MIRLGQRLFIGLLAIAAGCAEPPPADPAEVVVALLDDRRLTLQDFQRYLQANLAGDDLPGAAEEAAIKSRLFDAFVEERLLLLEAERRDLQVTDIEVEAFLQSGSPGDAGRDSMATRSDWDEATRRLKIEKLHEALAGDLPPLARGAERPHGGRSVGQGTPGRRVRLRSLMLESPDLAAQVSRDIRRGRLTFNEAVVANATAPEQGLAVDLPWDSLSDEHRGVLKNLKPGQVSRPLDVGGVTYLFQIEAWLKADLPDPAAEAEAARVRTERLLQAEALRALLSKLRKSVEISLNLGLLSFEYVPDDSVDPPDWNRVIGDSG